MKLLQNLPVLLALAVVSAVLALCGSAQAFNNFAHLINVTDPPYCSAIQGNTTIKISAPGVARVTVKCWHQGKGFGYDSTVARAKLNAAGKGSFVFPADKYPHGPITIRIFGHNASHRDICYLQLYNKGGVAWHEGLQKNPPPAAKGMKLIFADGFTKPLSIGNGDKYTFYDHKPPHGWQDFSWPLKFTSFHSPHNPFKRVGSYLRIRADQKTESTGLIASVHSDGHGITARLPCYFECRFIAPDAPGTWPAFWLLTDNMLKPSVKPCDELDILEGYGGNGPHEPNAGDTFMITPHDWAYPSKLARITNAMLHRDFPYPHPCHMKAFGIPSTWYETFHTYGCKITPRQTIYYVDNIEVGHHPTLPICKKLPLFFLINLATGGGWPVNLSRYNGLADMYVAWIRVYQGQTPAGKK